MRLFPLSALLLLCASASAAEVAAPRIAKSFFGRAIFADATPAAGAEVVLLRDGKEIARAVTDSDGAFSITASPGLCSLSVAGRVRAQVDIAEQGGTANVSALLPETAPAGAMGATDWLIAGGGLVLFVAPVATMIAVSGNGLSVSP
jgi:hypothetical protein